MKHRISLIIAMFFIGFNILDSMILETYGKDYYVQSFLVIIILFLYAILRKLELK